jgi:hypothetical protein
MLQHSEAIRLGFAYRSVAVIYSPQVIILAGTDVHAGYLITIIHRNIIQQKSTDSANKNPDP